MILFQRANCSYIVGDMVLVQFSQDGLWYRASVQQVFEVDRSKVIPEPPRLEVLFVDYGNSEITTFNKLVGF